MDIWNCGCLMGQQGQKEKPNIVLQIEITVRDLWRDMAVYSVHPGPPKHRYNIPSCKQYDTSSIVCPIWC